MLRFRAVLLATALAGALASPRAADADRRTEAARLPAPLRALLARFLDLEAPRPAEPALDDEFEAEEIDRARASRRAERDRDASGGAARDARRASGPSNP